MSRLSVIIPTFNRALLVREAIDSVLAQETSEPVEIIVVDDGSTDNTRTVLESFGSRISRIFQSNRGMNAARNVGIARATGEYIAFLDSDDAWLPAKVALQLSVLDQVPHIGFVFSNFYVWRGDLRIPDGLGKWMVEGESLSKHRTAQRRVQDLTDATHLPDCEIWLCEIYRLSLFQPVVLPTTAVVRKSVFQEMGSLPEDNWMCGDWEFFAQVSRRFGCAYLDIETALNRSHDDGVRLMRRGLRERTEQRLESIRRTWKADPAFSAKHGAEIAGVEQLELTRLVKLACLARDIPSARASLRDLEQVSGRPHWMYRLFVVLFLVPGVHSLAMLLRRGS